MPSVFNDNSCWGVKKSICTAFHYELHKEMQTSKLPELGIVPNSSSSYINPIQYSVSSNGYYGYQPHSINADRPKINNDTGCDCSDDSAMDVEENPNGCQVVNAGNQFMISYNILDSECLQSFRRKRHMSDNAEDVTKRMRKEEPAETGPKLPTHVTHHCVGGDGSSVRCTKTLTSRNKGHSQSTADDNDSATSLLLKKTHGCEIYMFDRTCDY